MKKTIQAVIVCVLFTCGLSYGQKISVAAIGGVPTTDLTSRNDESRRYTVGGGIEVKFGRFAVEGDALYKRIGNSLSFTSNDTSTIQRQRGNSWEFPILGKFYLSDGPIKPFVQTGYAFRKIWIDNDVSILSGSPVTNTVTQTSYTSDTGVGAVFGGGVRFGVGFVSIAPEFRYTRWGGDNFPSARNQAEFLVGLRF